MGAGNGYYNDTFGYYQAKTNLTWNTYDADSTGNDWSAWTTWDSNNVTIGMPVQPELPLVYTTDVIDYGSVSGFNPTINIDASTIPTMIIYYGNELASAGGIDSPSSVTINEDTTTVDAIEARYVQVDVSVDTEGDSAGDTFGGDLIYMPYIKSINVELKAQQTQRFLKNINSANLSGSIGRRTLDSGTLGGIGSISTMVTQVHLPEPKYVTTGYVVQDVDSADDDYISATTSQTPVVYINKDTNPPVLNIFDFDTYSHREPIDCVFDAMVSGLPQLRRSLDGNLVEDL